MGKKNELVSERARQADATYVSTLKSLTARELDDELDALEDAIERESLRRASRVETRSKLGPGTLSGALGATGVLMIAVLGWVVTAGADRTKNLADPKYADKVTTGAFALVAVLFALLACVVVPTWLFMGMGVGTVSESLDKLQAKRRAVRSEQRHRASLEALVATPPERDSLWSHVVSTMSRRAGRQGPSDESIG